MPAKIASQVNGLQATENTPHNLSRERPGLSNAVFRDELAVLGQRMGAIRTDVHVAWPARAGRWSTEVVVCSIEAAILQGYDGIVVCPVFDRTAGIIDDAVATGFPVITMIAECQAPSKRMTHVGQNNRAAAGELGKLVAEKWAVRASWA